MALAYAFSQHDPKTVGLADALARLGLERTAWNKKYGIRFNEENVEDGGVPGSPLQVHQVNDAELMRRRSNHYIRGLVLANEAGLGKTITYLLAIYGHARDLISRHKKKKEYIRFYPSLILAPTATIP